MEFFYICTMKPKITLILLVTFFSGLLWIFVSLSDEYFATLNLPVRIVDISEDYSLAELSDKNVTLRLKGQGWLLAQLTVGRSPEFIVSSNNKLGRGEVNLRNAIDQNLWLSSTVQVLEINPEKIDFTIEKIKTKTVAIVPDIILEFKPGYGLISDVVILDDTVTISGPSSLVNSIDFLKTEKMRLNSLEEKTILKLGFEEIEGVVYNRDYCQAEFDVQKIVDKNFENIVVETRRVPRSRELILYPNSIDVVLRGGINVLGQLTGDNISASVSYRDALRDTLGSIEPVIEIPENTILLNTKPKRLEYIIKKY